MRKTAALHKTGRPPRTAPASRYWKACRAVDRLDVGELERLKRYVDLRIDEQSKAPPGYTDREVVEEVREGAICYQLERVRCGKRRCHCMRGGKAHGPYWYAYRWHGGRVVSTYIGKKRKPPAPLPGS